jgi:hypothetical protein
LRYDDPDLRWGDPRLRYGQPFPATTTSMDNRISAVLSDSDVTAINAAIATIRAKLPFLVALTEQQRKTMAKGGTKSQGIIALSANFAAANPTALPTEFDAAEFAKDYALYAKFAPVMASIAQLNEDGGDTLMVLGGELYLQSTTTYAFAKVNNRNGRYDSYITPMKEYFKHPPTTPATPPPPSP